MFFSHVEYIFNHLKKNKKNQELGAQIWMWTRPINLLLVVMVDYNR